MTVEKIFSAVGDSVDILVPAGRTVTFSIAGSYVGTVQLVQVLDGGAFKVVGAPAANGTLTDSFLVTVPNAPNGRYRFRCVAYTSGSPACTMTDADLGVTPALVTKEIVFVETGGIAVYTGSVPIPAGATILDIIVNGVALWDNGTAATLKVGDAGNDAGYFTGVNLKATDLLAGESLSFDEAGGKAGSYIANSQVSPRYATAARIITATITTTGSAGSAGRTRVTVLYSCSGIREVIEAAKA